MTTILQVLLALPPGMILLAAFLLPALEPSALVGLVIPGETAVFVAGLTAHGGRLPLWSVILGAVCGAVLGDQIGFAIGRKLGPRLLDRLPPRLRTDPRLDRAISFIQRRGGVAVLLGRWTALLRALLPGLAGASGMRPRTFLIFNALGGATWAAVVAVLGFSAGAAYQHMNSTMYHVTAVAVGLALVAALTMHLRRRRCRNANGGAGTPAYRDRPLPCAPDPVGGPGP